MTRVTPDPSLHPAMGGSGSLIIGRKRIAHALGRSERTISRWLRRGILPTIKDGPHKNSLLCMRAADLARLRARPAPAGG